MKKYLLFPVAILLGTTCVFAQDPTQPSNPQNDVVVVSAGPALRHSQPLYIVKADNKTWQVVPTIKSSNGLPIELDEINQNLIQSVFVFRDKEATDRYGRLGQYGVVILELKGGSLSQMPAHLSERFKAN